MKSRGLEVTLLAENQVNAAGAVLARAFHDDPLSIYMLPDPIERARALPSHFTAFLRLGLLFGEVYSTPLEPEGAAIWLPPHGWEMTPEKTKEAGVDDLATLLPPGSFDRFLPVVRYTEPFHKKAVDPEHWYLFILGVDRKLQGQGLGGRLLQPILQRADRENLPCYLETFVALNIPFYERHGFRVVVHDVEPDSGIHFWTFRRDPR